MKNGQVVCREYTVGMTLAKRVLSMMLFTQCITAFALGQGLTLEPKKPGVNVGVSILSDTKGVTLDPYMKRLMTDLRTQWQERLKKKSLKTPANVEASVVDLTIGTDGRLLALRRDSSANTPYDEAAWDSAIAIHYAALPSGMKGSELKLRVEFLAN